MAEIVSRLCEAPRGLKNVGTEASLAILAYNIKRAIAVAGVAATLKAITG